ncbi:Poly [ADP-ribose] polymerase 1 (PARP-1) (ADP-ribosyltransferase diphtheria toxin-like 1) (ARTD1) (DNA ADP-ribosyltransferase PARP1) (NAD(+) ADP-ribosyltransferase 1) (ADPRT 1) (Poly[ADP-ribose] synthase 1) (Protein poly-ADP-ribosyltransferase PARP1) [Durusdinium trenchii]|uniref:PARP-type domain-containing protein n=1 Tax=Durusdinium trenchii TaxID=1381693 RepID=A0ABP0MNX6_9DINO
MSLSWAWSQGAWYVVDYAKTGRSTCKEFRCKKAIAEGELRIGIEAPEDDHRGSQLGWYHPPCLWKTFSFQKNANKKIESTEDIKNFHHLRNEDRELIESLLEGKTVESPKGAPSSSLRKKIITKVEGNTMTLTGPTFQFKEDLKKLGAKFNGELKAWIITKKDNDTFEHVEKFLAGDDDESVVKRPAKRQRT